MKSSFENFGRDELLKLPSEIRYHQEVCLHIIFTFCASSWFGSAHSNSKWRDDRSAFDWQWIPPNGTLTYGEYSERVLASFSGKSVDHTLMPQ